MSKAQMNSQGLGQHVQYLNGSAEEPLSVYNGFQIGIFMG